MVFQKTILRKEADVMYYRNNRLSEDMDNWEEDFSQLTFFHGTSDALSIETLLPSDESGNLREDWRKKLNNKVFFTDSLYSAARYAKKACAKYGGNPVVYEVHPVGDIWHIHTNEYVADSAEIIGIVEILP